MGRSFRHLTQEDRYSIERYLGNGLNHSEIASILGFHRSTVSREVRRNSNERGKYNGLGAQRAAWTRKPCLYEYKDRRKIRGELELAIRDKLSTELWSPQQISARLKDEWGVRISHQSIYNYVYQCMRQGDTIHRCLRRFNRRKRRYGVRRRRGLPPSPGGKKRIQERGIEAESRSQTGHWERDLVEGRRGQACLLTIVDRTSRYTVIRRLEGRQAELADRETVDVFKQSGRVSDAKLRCLSMTNDNGFEFHRFKTLEKALRAPIYFTEPYQAWQRGTNENTNGLIRQIFPKRTDFSQVPIEHIRKCEQLLNRRPRRVLGYRTPEEIHFSRQMRLIPTKAHYRRIIRTEFW